MDGGTGGFTGAPATVARKLLCLLYRCQTANGGDGRVYQPGDPLPTIADYPKLPERSPVRFLEMILFAYGWVKDETTVHYPHRTNFAAHINTDVDESGDLFGDANKEVALLNASPTSYRIWLSLLSLVEDTENEHSDYIVPTEDSRGEFILKLLTSENEQLRLFGAQLANIIQFSPLDAPDPGPRSAWRRGPTTYLCRNRFTARELVLLYFALERIPGFTDGLLEQDEVLAELVTLYTDALPTLGQIPISFTPAGFDQLPRDGWAEAAYAYVRQVTVAREQRGPSLSAAVVQLLADFADHYAPGQSKATLPKASFCTIDLLIRKLLGPYSPADAGESIKAILGRALPQVEHGLKRMFASMPYTRRICPLFLDGTVAQSSTHGVAPWAYALQRTMRAPSGPSDDERPRIVQMHVDHVAMLGPTGKWNSATKHVDAAASRVDPRTGRVLGTLYPLSVADPDVEFSLIGPATSGKEAWSKASDVPADIARYSHREQLQWAMRLRLALEAWPDSIRNVINGRTFVDRCPAFAPVFEHLGSAVEDTTLIRNS